MPLQQLTLEHVWAQLEEFASHGWRTPQELEDELRTILAHAGEDSALRTFESVGTRYLSFGHGGLIRRPRSGGWAGQGRAEYTSARHVLGTTTPQAQDSQVQVVRHHIQSHGPASRQDIAWWSGLGLRQVDTALECLSSELHSAAGPLDRTYYDLKDTPAPRDISGVHLLPEFDALLCGYEAKARDRFVTAEQHERLWNRANGLLKPPLLLDGRIGGFWRLEGTSRHHELEVFLFPKTRRPRKAEIATSAELVNAALDITIANVNITRG